MLRAANLLATAAATLSLVDPGFGEDAGSGTCESQCQCDLSSGSCSCSCAPTQEGSCPGPEGCSCELNAKGEPSFTHMCPQPAPPPTPPGQCWSECDCAQWPVTKQCDCKCSGDVCANGASCACSSDGSQTQITQWCEAGPPPTPPFPPAPAPMPTPTPTPGPAAPGTVVSKGNGKCLDLPGGSTQDGTLLWTWSCSGGATQRWKFDEAGQLAFDNGGSACVDLPGNDYTNGNQLEIWSCAGWPQQLWGYDPDMGTIYLSSSLEGDATKCFDLRNGGADDGTPLQIWDCVGNLNQQFEYTAPYTMM